MKKHLERRTDWSRMPQSVRVDTGTTTLNGHPTSSALHQSPLAGSWVWDSQKYRRGRQKGGGNRGLPTFYFAKNSKQNELTILYSH